MNSSAGNDFKNIFYLIVAMSPKEFKPYYDPDCDNIPTNIAANSPVTPTGSGSKFKMTTDQNGLKYKITLSSDYPNCGAALVIKNCRKPNIYATDLSVFCDHGTYTNSISGGTQICAIPSFFDQVVLISLERITKTYPSSPCNTIQFEVLP
ncbi:hypothetical protein [Leptospira stimsonii]|uniref:Uncharacterized protein n=1 Tax=Leptospira stimsonii TaxID=2202203 RepID=A0A8B3CKT2_9LEPT|nr:hypothetical protein [Leptospira stimsonii]RHX83229.1 hypothetical protein DLM78_22235 [Leptospira stimsonii]